MKDILKRIPFVKQAVAELRKITCLTPERVFIKKVMQRQHEDIRKYMKSSSIPKLHIGCQSHPMEEWLNVDLVPKLGGIVYMDATNEFPFKDAVFEYVFTEHMIEHIPLDKGQFMLKECYRVLKPGGILRVVTPNLDSLLNYYLQPGLPLHSDYTDFSRRYFPQQPPVFNATVVFNNFFRDWGHQFIYNEATLTTLLQMTGFRDILRLEVGESSDPVLCGLENHHLEITDRFNRMESLVMEAIK